MKHRISIPLIAIVLLIAWMARAYPPAKLTVPESDIIFAHNNHTDLECLDCHQDATSSTSSGDRLFPEMDVCGDCHDIEEVDDCGICHRNTDDPAASPDPDRPIKFNHKKHFELNLDCDHCHRGVAESEKSSPTHMPVMSLCMDCHDGEKAENDCDLCHAGKIVLLDIHPPDWRHSHGEQASGEPENCTGCHQEQTACLECHPNEHDSWSHSYHRSMTQLVNDDTVAGGFDGKTRQIFDWRYTAEKRGA